MANQQVLVTEENLTEFAEKFVASGLGGSGGGSKNLEEWFGVSDEMQTLAATPREIINECKDIFATVFPDITMPNEVTVDGLVYMGEFPSIEK